MGLKTWVRGILGVDEILDDREAIRELITEILRVSALQAETTVRLTAAIESVFNAYATDGTPPEGRHMTDEYEIAILEQADHDRRN